MKYLIGVDGSTGSCAAVRFVGRLLVEETDPVLLYYSPPSISLVEGRDVAPEVLDRVQQSLTDVVFQQAIAALPMSARDRVITIVGTQKPKAGLLAAAEEHQADVIVVGSHGVRRFEWLRLGRVGRTLAHSATRPVLIVREPQDTVEGRPFRVMVTCDRTTTANCPKSLIKRIAWPEGTEAEVLSVYESYLGDVPEWIKETLAREGGLGTNVQFEPFLEEKQHAHEQVDAWCADLPLAFRKHTSRLVEGHAADAILAQLAESHYDLVVVGAHRHRQLSQVLLGSTSHSVLTQAPCSVLVVREHDSP